MPCEEDLFTDEDKADLRLTAEAGLTDRCEVLRQDLIEDRGIGVPRDPADTWPVTDEDVPVNVSPDNTGRTFGQQGAALTSEGRYNAKFKAGYDIRNTDKIRVTTLGGRVFRMIGPRYASNEIVRIMACEEEV
jgi:hypothetical protein